MHTVKPLASFVAIFMILLMGFASWAFLVYGSSIYILNTPIFALESVFTMALGKFDTKELLVIDRVMTPIYFFFLMIVINWLMFNILITIIMESHYFIKEHQELTPKDHLVVDLMIETLFKGVKKGADFSNTTRGI